jgi:hypothetical protein
MPEPPVPGSVPRLSLTPQPEKPAAPPAKPAGKPAGKPPVSKSALNLKVAKEALAKAGGKPPVPAPRPGSILQKRPALSPVARAGVAVVVILLAVGGIYSYRIFFPPPSQDLRIKTPLLPKVAPAKDPNADAEAARAAEEANAKRIADKARADAAANEAQVTPTPTPSVESVMAVTSLTTDVKVNSTRLDAALAASPDFRAFVANASIGGVFQGKPSRALVNGVIVREGQVVDTGLAITFERIDATSKMIYFRDASGAEVSKNY